ncbi:FAD-dependent oxidoreductase [Dactylosporangium sp. NPDC049742]|uniref:FAD-dependent oxidoreductase n=1 Tax=Dactylosporangium sp. NPDC049742 TaxID=3154737 RepID=UPI00343DF193
MRAIVVGGGIGGLATARGLGRQGWDVTVLERRPDLSQVGAGISLWPNAMRALHHLGVGDAVERAGGRVHGGGLRAWDGRQLSRVRLPEPPVVLHRADLHEILLDGLPATVHTGQHVTGVAGVEALDADLVVGADGIGSAVRAAYAPQVRIRDSGQVSWRAVVRGDVDGGGETTGPKGWRFGYAPTGPGTVYWYAAAPGPPRTGSPAEQLAELTGALAGWHDPIPRLLAATAPGQLSHHPLLDLHPVAPMRFGTRVALVGDAAHAMTPNLGQGACQALEDAVTLALLLPKGAPVSVALEVYDRQRRPRVAAVARRSWQVGRLAGARGRLTGAMVRTLFRLTPDRVTVAAAERVAAWTPDDVRIPAAVRPAAARR